MLDQNSWREVTVGDICKFQYGKALPNLTRNGGPVCVFGSNGVVGYHDAAISDGPTIVIGRKGSLGEVNFSESSCWPIDTAYFIDRTVTTQNLRWLSYRLAALGLNRLNKSAAVPGLNREDAYRQAIFLPPLTEQRRIAAILDQTDLIKAKRQKALNQLDALTQSIFNEMFGDLMDASSQWEMLALSDIIAGFESGKSVVADDEDDISSPYRVLKVSAVTSLEYRPMESKAVPVDYVPQQSYFVKDGDLLFSRANTTDLIGATALVSNTPPNLLLSDKLWRFIWHKTPRAEPLFVAHLFRQQKFRAEIGRRASGTSGSMKNISQPKVLSISVAVPPIELQQVFAERVRVIDKLKIVQRASLAELDTLFASLQHSAFRGEL
jgi:type I restriction enzyme S subunit